MRAFIAEDEPPAHERLVETLARVAPQVQIVGHADSVQGTLAWLAANPAPDLLLLDIQLADGLSLELFDDGRIHCPTIFTTAYDRFAIDAFRALAVDYLLKPLAEAALAQALSKLERLRASFGTDVRALLRQLQPQRYRQRLLGRQSNDFHTLAIERVAYIVSVDKLAFAVDTAGERYLLEQSLSDLEAELEPARFFRASRQLLVSIGSVVRFAAAGKGRLTLELKPPLTGDVRVSPERAAALKAWLGG